MTSRARNQASFTPPSGIDVLRLEPRVYIYCAHRNVTLGVWVGQATLPSLQGVAEVSREMVRRHPEGHSSIIFILDKIPPPSAEVSEHISRAFNERSGLSCVSVIVEGTGFWGSGMRGMLTNARRNAAGSSLLRLHNTVEEAVSWMLEPHLERTGVTLDTKQFVDAVRWIRERGASHALDAT